MLCENYREALMEAAAADAEPSRELRSHLDACPSCRAAFAEERQLLAAIDTGLRTTANAEVPASLFPRVRARLNERPVPRSSWIPASAALAAVVVLVATIIFVRGAGRGTAEQNPRMTAAARSVVPSETKTVPAAVPHAETSAPPSNGKPTRPVKLAPAVKLEEVSVLIPAGQKQAMDALLVRVQQGKVDASALLAQKPEVLVKKLQVSPLEVSPIELKLLPDVSEESGSQSEKTDR